MDLKTKIIKPLLYIRAKLVLKLQPVKKERFYSSTAEPISRKFGIDRGTPIDRYYIAKFVENNKKYIHGNCLEIEDPRYTSKYGESVTKIDILDINKKNKKANIIGDLRNLTKIKDNSYDCLVITQVIGMIDDIDSVIAECYRILKPKGTLLLTSSSMS